MSLSLFQIFNFVLILAVLVIFIRFAWGMVFDKNYQPVEWQHRKKQGKISGELLHKEKYYPDKVRFFNWWFQVERLKKEGVEGAFAELGVYRGDSAYLLRLMDPGREIHLFDTFEGFPEQDLEGETGEASTYTTANFADTSLEKVKKKVGADDLVHYHAGYFPDSASRLSGIRYALVNMDADLYKPTLAGLEYFYPRLSAGGVILVHDHNHKWPGIMKAVREFSNKENLIVIPVPDMEGTIMHFGKQAI